MSDNIDSNISNSESSKDVVTASQNINNNENDNSNNNLSDDLNNLKLSEANNNSNNVDSSIINNNSSSSINNDNVKIVVNHVDDNNSNHNNDLNKPRSGSTSPLLSTSTPPTLETTITFSERIHYYKEALKPSNLDLTIIQHLAEQGIPESQGLRSLYWKILLRYLPLDQSHWETSLKSSREIYHDWVNELMINPWKEMEGRPKDDHPLSTSHDSKWNEYFKDQNILVDIEKDVRRTFPALHFFNRQEEGKSIHYEALRRILFIYAKLNPGIKYVQGMNEVLGPIYYTFATDPDQDCKENAEADSFYCFTNLMSEIRDNFCKSLDKSESGVISSIKKLNFLLKKKDRQLWKDLEEKKLHPQFYSFRWITLLLSQEFELPDVLRLWDSLFSDPNRFDFLYYFCCAMLICIRNQLLEAPFGDNLKLLQSYPNNIDFHTIYSTALSLKDGTFNLNTENPLNSGQSYLKFFNPFAKATSPPTPLSGSPSSTSPLMSSINNNSNTINTTQPTNQYTTSNNLLSTNNNGNINNNNNSNQLTPPTTQTTTSSFSPPIADSLKNFFNKFSSIR
ncbi:TBC1 domain family member 13 [Heterostelium album PN500]|uniref:TBC1 domain family member 13 n=1 Tax=Heterostelium pallidum (strain ATCC 26659 / Pp 5 / PN500) TaxID=670386 RepID=D3BTH5_HETP5|nr:TBC1 domain family member 13 [Heterostelium album PN500]EFA75392.1 TBC1 domain family member 13 [Heterostelium album PN500]|eukprot:XP_020427526.1 TBC1 domain family member 13 [Heterostelium album PN500]